ncbi:hypothetical protein AB0C11_33395 [Streptomyces sp. NPDC039016]|uniref:hypothetical protein n=1 Tax=Streptomyces sp. NPDC039016 TaxID=3154330 RepID=UPI0033DA0460
MRLGLIDPPRLVGYGINNAPSLAVWPHPGMPTRGKCAELVSTQGVNTVEIRKGMVLCAQTDAGRIAVLTVTSVSNSFSTGEMAQVSVWSEHSDQS